MPARTCQRSIGMGSLHPVRIAGPARRVRLTMTMQPATPTVGETIPDFTLRRTFEESISLSELRRRGPVVMAFYVFDFGNV